MQLRQLVGIPEPDLGRNREVLGSVGVERGCAGGGKRDPADVGVVGDVRCQTIGCRRGRHPGLYSGIPSEARLGCSCKSLRHHDRARLGSSVRTVLDDALLGPQVSAVDHEPDEDHDRQQPANHEHEHLPSL